MTLAGRHEECMHCGIATRSETGAFLSRQARMHSPGSLRARGMFLQDRTRGRGRETLHWYTLYGMHDGVHDSADGVHDNAVVVWSLLTAFTGGAWCHLARPPRPGVRQPSY